MYSKFWPKGGLPGVLHHFTETLTAFEFTSGAAPTPHSIVFVGGLGDGLATTSYLSDLVPAIQPKGWSLFSVTLTSAYQSWGMGSLDRDTDELAQCIKYVKEYKTDKFGHGKVVIMGHSTGSQDVLHYLYRPNPHQSVPSFDPDLEHVKRPAVEGAIMQAPVSDREVMQIVMEFGFRGKTPAELQSVFAKLLLLAREAERQGHELDTLLPLNMTYQIGYPYNTPVSARRFLSLISPDSPQSPSEDDVFSSDMSDDTLDKTFGMIRTQGLLRGRLLVLESGADQSVPKSVDKKLLLSRWKHALERSGASGVWDQNYGGIIPHASHALSNDDQAEPRRDLVRRVLGFLADL